MLVIVLFEKVKKEKNLSKNWQLYNQIKETYLQLCYNLIKSDEFTKSISLDFFFLIYEIFMAVILL